MKRFLRLLLLVGLFWSATCFADPARIMSVVVDTQGNRYLLMANPTVPDMEFYRVVRLKRDGTLDRDWATNGVLDLSHIVLNRMITHPQIAVSINGDVILAGVVVTPTATVGSFHDLIVIRVKPDGTIKNNGDGQPETRVKFTNFATSVRAISFDNEERILVATADDLGMPGNFKPRVAVVRFTHNCVLDRDFNRGRPSYIDLSEDYPNMMPGGLTNVRFLPDGRILLYTLLLGDEEAPGKHVILRLQPDGRGGVRNVTLQNEVRFISALGRLPEGMPSANGSLLYVAETNRRGKIEIRRYNSSDGTRDAAYGIQVMEMSRPIDTLDRTLNITSDGILYVVYQSGKSLVIRELNKDGTSKHDTIHEDAFASADSSVCHILMRASGR